MKICLLSYRGNPYCGGQGIYLSYLSRELIKRGHDVQVLVGPPYPIYMDGAKIHKIANHNFFGYESRDILTRTLPSEIFSPLHFFEFASSRIGVFPEIFAFSVRAFSYLKNLMERERFDIIHDNQCLGYGFLLMKRLGVPIVATIHHPLSIDRATSFESPMSLKKRIKTVLYYPLLMQSIVSKRVDRIIAVSHNSSQEITRSFGVPQERIDVVYNGLDTEIFRPVEGVSKRAKNLIFVGNVGDKKKGVTYLLEALSLLPKEVTLTVVDGGAPARISTQRLVEEYRLEGRIQITGKIETEELVRRYSEAEVAIVPSLYEGFGFPAAEAMACELPIIATRAGALPEVVGEDGGPGIIIPPRDPRTLASTAEKLLADPSLRKRMGKAARQRILSNFTWGNAARQLEDTYRKVIDAYH
jgi:glycosyltransferase involved in cell wall biosynthesis